MPDARTKRDDLELVIQAALAAGAIALGYFGNNPRAWTKEADSPVTEADIAADRYLRTTLIDARPGYGWLSEETADTPERLGTARQFIVDPIDGTRGFMAGNIDWCVSVAVVEDGRPYAAALFVPAREELFQAVEGGGTLLNDRPVAVAGPQLAAAHRYSGPARHMRALQAAGFPIADRRVTPSLAYRLALVAAGRLDIATAAPDARDWDLAAADLLVHEAGGTLRDPAGRLVRYNRADPRHPALIAASEKLLAEAIAPVARSEAEAERTRSA